MWITLKAEQETQSFFNADDAWKHRRVGPAAPTDRETQALLAAVPGSEFAKLFVKKRLVMNGLREEFCLVFFCDVPGG